MTEGKSAKKRKAAKDKVIEDCDDSDTLRGKLRRANEKLHLADVIRQAQSFTESQALQVRQDHSQEIRAMGAKHFWDRPHDSAVTSRR